MGLEEDWADLPHDCLITVLSRLSIGERCRGPMLVCKSWLQASKGPGLYSIFNWETHINQVTLSHRYGCWIPSLHKVDSLLRSFVNLSEGSLTEIRVRNCSNRSLSFVADRCPRLQVLSIETSPNVTNEAIRKIVYHCSDLRELYICSCCNVSDHFLILLGKKFRDLKIVTENFLHELM